MAYSQKPRDSVKSIHVPTVTHSQLTPMVVIPPSSAESRRTDFTTYDEPSAENKGQPRKRKRDSEGLPGAHQSQTKDQRAASEETLLQLQEVIQDVFEAEDQSQPDGSGAVSINVDYFVSAYHEDREILTLAPAVHIRLDSLLHKVIKLGRFGDVPVEHLQRLQGLSVGALNSAESSELHINAGYNADDFDSWISRLDLVDAGLRSAKSILRIMTGGREEKQLFPEELLQSLLGVVRKVIDSCVIPIVELRSSSSTSGFFEAASSSKKVLSQLLFDATKVMALIAKLLIKVEVAEIIVTKIQFFATPLLFVDNAYSEKESILGIQKFESLRRTAMDQIATIFSRYPEQQISVFDEILTSLQKLPVTEKHARQYRLTEGKSIMLVSALVMQLVQTSASRSVSATATASQRTSPLSNRDEESGSEVSEGKHGKPFQRDLKHGEDLDKSEDTDHPDTSTAMQKLSKNATFLIDHATKSAQYFIKYIIQRAQRTAKTSESPHRQHLDMFVQDFIAVLGVPEWPAAELLLRTVFASCRNIAELPKSLAPAKNMALELLGMMGQAISDLVSNTCQAAKSLENQDSEFSGYLRQMLDDYMGGSLESNELVMWDGPYHAIVEYLESNSSDDLQIRSAHAYYLAQWAKAASSGGLKADAKSERLAFELAQMLAGVKSVVSEYHPLRISAG
jgi:cohesin loading factor subunit SCC2